MRLLRFIAFLCFVGALWVVGALVWSLIAPASSRMDAYASARIRRVCGWQANCKIMAGDLFEGDWDTVFIFGPGVSQHEIDQILGSGLVRARPSERIVVLERNNHVVEAQHAPESTGKPVDGQIEFEGEDHRELRVVRYDREAYLRVTGFPLEPRGRFYVLTTSDLP